MNHRVVPYRRLVALVAAGALVWLTSVPGPVHAAFPRHSGAGGGRPRVSAPGAGAAASPATTDPSAQWLQVVPPRAGTVPDRNTQPLASSLRVLQMNLCNSGIARCYTNGRSISEAIALIRRLAGSGSAPDLVAVNEVCLRDVQNLLPVLARVWPGDFTWSLFAPARDRATGPAPQPFKCRNQDPYGSGILGHVPPASFHGITPLVGRYAAQSGDREERAYGCAYLTGNLYACVTHLSAEDHRVAFRQCQELLRKVLPGFERREGNQLTTVVSGDFNLLDQPGTYGVGNCIPRGSYRTGDNSLQHVVVAGGTTGAHSIFPMQFTDHPALLATVALSRA
ncbi:MAG: hypothetical protein J2P15_23960 [Micromonosporaceae bacterium]|nr:hypothetical protein [Micromonosporaceae bacterium]